MTKWGINIISKSEEGIIPWNIIIVFLIISIGIMSAGYYYYNLQTEQIKDTKADELSSITALKVNEITRWREGLISEANVIENTPVLARKFGELIEDPYNTVIENSILVWMESILKYNDFDCVSLLDSSGNEVLSSNENGRISKPCFSESHKDEIKTRKILLSDFHRTDENTHMSIFIPIFDPDDNTVRTGLLFIRIDIDQLLSIVKDWPTPSDTAETLIIRKEGDEILFLSELRYKEIPDLSLRMPVSKVSLPAAMAARGETGVVEGEDYRDVKVLASIEPIPDTEWFIVSKVDQSEIYEPVKRTSFYFAIFGAIFLIFIGLSIYFMWYTNKNKYQIKEKEANYVRSLIESSLDPFFSISLDGIINDFNEASERLFGIPRSKILGTEFAKNFPHIQQIRELLDTTVLKGSVSDYEITVPRPFGNEITLLLNTSLYKNEMGETGGIFTAARDITDLKRAENALKTSHDNLEKLVDDRTKELSVANVQLEHEVLETKNAKDALESSSQRLIRAQKFAHIGDWEFDVETNTSIWSDELYRIYGFESSDNIALETIIEGMHPEDRDYVNKTLADWIENGYGETFEYRVVRPDGSIRYVDSPAEAVIDESTGKVVKLYGTVLDVTEQKEAEKSIKESEEKFRSIVEFANAAIILSDINGNILFWNPGAEKAFQYNVNEIIGQPLTTIMPERHRSAYLKAMEHFRETGKGNNFGKTIEIEGLKKDGTEISVQLSFTKWISGDEVLFSGILYDITDRKHAENDLKKSELKYHSLFKNMLNGFAYHETVVDKNGKPIDYKFLEVNNAFEKMTGLKSKNIIGKLVTEVLPGIETDSANWIGRYGKVALENKELRFEQFSEPLGKWYSIISYCPKKGTFVTLFEDVTDRKNAEEEVRKYHDHLEEMVKERTARLEIANKELESFSYSVSHDLRAPLRSIDGFSQALLDDYPDKLDKQGKDYLNRVRAASQKMAKLIDAILSLSRLTRGEMKRTTVNLTDTVNSIVSGLKIAHPERKVEFVIAENVTANCDAMMLQIVLENLFTNACKFTGKHPTAKIEFGVTEKEGKTVCFVKDDGAGFDMKYVDKIFTAFQRLHTESEFQGIGIGLATVQRIIHRHSGEIWAEGEIEKGATFYFTFE